MSTASASLGTTVSNASSGQFLPRNDVKLSEPDINWSYAVIERQSKENLTTSLLPFNLGRMILEGDASQNLELYPGDVVTIFSKADIRVPQTQQTRFVRLEGEFVSSGVYSVNPGETLRQLVQRAGGLTPEAYLYGSEFTRESTRRVQQQRLNEYVDQIALQASTNATNNAGAAINAQDTAAVAAQQVQTQNIITSLRQARATGRIVLELAPDASNVAQLPDLQLEDGDKFIVPRVPSTVSVDGAVYNQNSFLYDPHRRLGDYVRLAGGANRDADKNRAYVIRAGGSVISKQYSSSLRGNGFDSVRLFPGDTVVIPLNLDKGKTMRLIVDIAQIVGQFGIAIAAANTVLGQ
jgi:protein involved in polysaccharide export with SLBB domain